MSEVLRELALHSPADRRNGDFAVLLYIAALAARGSERDAVGAWAQVRPVTGPAIRHSEIARAVFGDDRQTAAQLVGQCLRRLRGSVNKTGPGYDPPLVAAVDAKERLLPPDAGAGRDGYHGYVPLRILGGPAPRPPKRPLDSRRQSGPVKTTTQPLDSPEQSGGVKTTTGKGRRKNPAAAGATTGSPADEHGPSLRSGPEEGEPRSRAQARDGERTPTDRARSRGLPGYPEFKPADGAVEGDRTWNEALAWTLTNAALSDAGIAAGTPERKQAFEPWRQAVLRVLLPPKAVADWRRVARALTAHLLDEGAGKLRGPDRDDLAERIDKLERAVARVAAGRIEPATAAAADGAVERTETAITRWRERAPVVAWADSEGPPPF